MAATPHTPADASAHAPAVVPTAAAAAAGAVIPAVNNAAAAATGVWGVLGV